MKVMTPSEICCSRLYPEEMFPEGGASLCGPLAARPRAPPARNQRARGVCSRRHPRRQYQTRGIRCRRGIDFGLVRTSSPSRVKEKPWQPPPPAPISVRTQPTSIQNTQNRKPQPKKRKTTQKKPPTTTKQQQQHTTCGRIGGVGHEPCAVLG